MGELAGVPPTLRGPFVNVCGHLADAEVTAALSGGDIDGGGPSEAAPQ